MGNLILIPTTSIMETGWQNLIGRQTMKKQVLELE